MKRYWEEYQKENYYGKIQLEKVTNKWPYNATRRIFEIDYRRKHRSKDQGCDSNVEIKMIADNREKWRMAADHSTD